MDSFSLISVRFFAFSSVLRLQIIKEFSVRYGRFAMRFGASSAIRISTFSEI